MIFKSQMMILQDFCGISTRNSVSRIICKLKEEGIIKIVNQKILILDVDFLKQYVQC